MLKLKPNCEHCDKDLPPNSLGARICSFECTWCADCDDSLLHNVCPNCGGGLEKRPLRPKEMLAKNPAQAERYYNPVDFENPNQRLDRLLKYKGIPPEER